MSNPSFVGDPIHIKGGSSVIINPGTGPVEDATEEHAVENIKHFLTDCDQPGISWLRIPDYDYGEGRYAFLLWKDVVCHEVQMPGLPLAQVRFTGAEDQNIWHFPRLYVDGSSWVWQYAVLNEKRDWDTRLMLED